MFFKKPLYKAKQDTLLAGVDLINARSKAMHEVLIVIKASQIDIQKKIDDFKLTLNNTKDHLSEIERQEWDSYWDLKFGLEREKTAIKYFVKEMEKRKLEIISTNNSNHSTSLYLYDPYSDFHIGSQTKDFFDHFMPSFFSGNTYTQTKDKEATFETAWLNERNMISFRGQAASVMIATLYLLSLTSTFAAAIALVAYAHPVAGFLLLGLAATFALYFAIKLPVYMDRFESQLTTIDEKIDLGESDKSLFPELDLLVELERQETIAPLGFVV